VTNESWRAAWELYRTARELPATERDVLLGGCVAKMWEPL
jgi:hypothetical protein